MTTTVQRDTEPAEQIEPRPRYSRRSYRVESVDRSNGSSPFLACTFHHPVGDAPLRSRLHSAGRRQRLPAASAQKRSHAHSFSHSSRPVAHLFGTHRG